MRLIEQLDGYATIDLSTYVSGTELGPRIALIRPGGTVTRAVFAFKNSTAISGGTTSAARFYLVPDATGTWNLSTINTCGVFAPVDSTAYQITRELDTGANSVTYIVATYGAAVGRQPLELVGHYITGIITSDRTGGTVTVDVLLYGD